jgi:short-subunit dehydrogenase
MPYFQNKIVWITGASAGIGEATAIALAKEGAKLVISARRVEELNRVKLQLKLPESHVMVLPMDAEKQNEFQSLCDQVIDRFGRIDILFNNAGISQRGQVTDTQPEVYRKLMEVNFFGVVALTKVVLPYMIKQNAGQIAVTSSLSGKLGSPHRSGYCASKHALHGFFDALRAEVYSNNIQITMICPGYINTNISINALSPDGTKHGKKDQNQEHGLDVTVCANKIILAIKNKKTEVYMGGKEVLGVYLKRFLPNLLNKILIKQIPS